MVLFTRVGKGVLGVILGHLGQRVNDVVLLGGPRYGRMEEREGVMNIGKNDGLKKGDSCMWRRKMREIESNHIRGRFSGKMELAKQRLSGGGAQLRMRENKVRDDGEEGNGDTKTTARTGCEGGGEIVDEKTQGRKKGCWPPQRGIYFREIAPVVGEKPGTGKSASWKEMGSSRELKPLPGETQELP